MKKLVVLLFFFISFKLVCIDIKVINKAFILLNDEKATTIDIVRYRKLYGFKLNSIYFLAEKHVYLQTIRNPKRNFKWHCFVKSNGEFLRLRKYIWVLTLYDYITGLVQYVINTNMDNEDMIININFIIHKKELKID